MWQGCDRRWNSCLGCLTGPVYGRVWIVFLCVNPTISYDVVECIIHETTVATTVVLRVTVHQLLLRQCNQLACTDSVDTFNRSSCWECPATPCRNYNRPSSSFASSQNLASRVLQARAGSVRRAAPSVISMWPSKNISHIQDSYLIFSNSTRTLALILGLQLYEWIADSTPKRVWHCIYCNPKRTQN